MNTELTTGNYDKAYKYATGTDTILDNYHLIIDRLGATREEIGDTIAANKLFKNIEVSKNNREII